MSSQLNRGRGPAKRNFCIVILKLYVIVDAPHAMTMPAYVGLGDERKCQSLRIQRTDRARGFFRGMPGNRRPIEQNKICNPVATERRNDVEIKSFRFTLCTAREYIGIGCSRQPDDVRRLTADWL